MSNKITAAKIGPMPRGFTLDMPKVTVTLEDGSTEVLFSFYPDEISFSESEFIGLTPEQGRSLKFKKDKAYLQS